MERLGGTEPERRCSSSVAPGVAAEEVDAIVAAQAVPDALGGEPAVRPRAQRGPARLRRRPRHAAAPRRACWPCSGSACSATPSSTSVRRRRRELAMLRVLGFARPRPPRVGALGRAHHRRRLRAGRGAARRGRRAACSGSRFADVHRRRRRSATPVAAVVGRGAGHGRPSRLVFADRSRLVRRTRLRPAEVLRDRVEPRPSVGERDLAGVEAGDLRLEHRAAARWRCARPTGGSPRRRGGSGRRRASGDRRVRVSPAGRLAMSTDTTWSWRAATLARAASK